MDPQPTGTTATPAELSKNLSLMIWDVAFFSIMVGCGEQYLSAFAVALGFSPTVSGLITTVPLLCGAALQTISPWAVARLGSHRKWVVGCSAVQAAAFIPLAIAAAVGSMPVWLLFVVAGFYWGAGLSAGPAWNAWVSNVIPADIRSQFLARRTRIGQFCLLLAYVVGGLVLQYGKSHDATMTVFMLVFAVAGACRTISVMSLAAKTEPQSLAPATPVHAQELRGIWRRGGAGPLLVYLWLMFCGAQIAGPYFAPYILNDLKFDYTQYMLIFGMSFLAKVLSMPMWGRFAHRYGTRMMLIVSGLIIIPLPVFWIVSRELPYILALQFVAGFFWGAFELGIILIFLEAIPVERRTSVLTIYNLGFAVASAIGSIGGGILLSRMAHTTDAYYWLFGISGVARMLILPLVAWLPGQTMAERRKHLQKDFQPEDLIEQPEPLGTALAS